MHLLIPFPRGCFPGMVKRRNLILAFWAGLRSAKKCACSGWINYWLIVPEPGGSTAGSCGSGGNPDMSLQASLHLLVKGTNNIYEVNGGHEAFVQAINYPFEMKSIFLTILCFVGVGGLYLFSTMLAMRNKSLVPTRDPRLNESLAFENM